jgi:two-component system NtrC family sensor kinase
MMTGDDQTLELRDKSREVLTQTEGVPRETSSTDTAGTGDKPEFTLGKKEAEHLDSMEKAFLLRPRLSIRLRIVAGFLLCFFLLAATGIINLAILYQARGKLHFLDISQDLSLAVERARHFERMDYPNQENLRAARESAKNAADLLISEGVSVLDVAGERELVSLSYRLGHYVQVIDQALEVAESPSPDPAKLRAVADEMETQGGEALEQLRVMKAHEAASVNRVLRVSQEMPFIFGAVMLLIIFWITKLLANTITDSLNRMEQTTQRIAGGDYALIKPTRRYRDELSDLTLAVNRMLMELRAREAQLIKADKLASVGAFTAGIAQQLSGVFNSVQNRVAVFLGEPSTAKQCSKCDVLEGILADTRQGREAIEGLLEFTRDKPVAQGSVSLVDLIESARKVVQYEMATRNITFHSEIPEDMAPVRGDFNQLRQVFLNLFHNAVQAMPSGGSLSVHAGFLGEDRVEISVADQGVGIPREDLPHLFDPFHTPKDKANVSGMGLSVSHRIVKKLGGDIRVESVVGKGTTVHITLPLAG